MMDIYSYREYNDVFIDEKQRQKKKKIYIYIYIYIYISPVDFQFVVWYAHWKNNTWNSINFFCEKLVI